MCNDAVQKIQQCFVNEFETLMFEVNSENGQLNENNVLYTVYVEGNLDFEGEAVIEFAKTVFDEVWVSNENEDVIDEMIIYGVIYSGE